MTQLSRSDLYSLEEYAEVRPQFRQKIIEHKKNRRVIIGDHAALYFEDKLTMQYQIQEMLRIEKIFEAKGIQDELDVYNPLIPDGSNLKATFMIEYDDVEERKVALARLKGIEMVLWLQVDGFDKVYAIANEDLERENDEKTAAVHFVRFELSTDMISALRQGKGFVAGISHPQYDYAVKIEGGVRESLMSDFQ